MNFAQRLYTNATKEKGKIISQQGPLKEHLGSNSPFCEPLSLGPLGSSSKVLRVGLLLGPLEVGFLVVLTSMNVDNHLLPPLSTELHLNEGVLQLLLVLPLCCSAAYGQTCQRLEHLVLVL